MVIQMYLVLYILIYSILIWSFPSCSVVKWRRQWHPTPVLLPGKSHGRRSLVGCSPWGREESYTTAQLHFPFSLSCIGEGNGSPLQCSCLENPRDGEACWAAVYGVAQSRTRLKRLSSSSSSSGKESVWNAGDTGDAGLIPGSGRSPGGEHGNPLRGKFHVWKIPWTEEPGGLWSKGPQRVGCGWAQHSILIQFFNYSILGERMEMWLKLEP